MSTNTSIEWTDATWNPTRGCARVSEGCRNCYAERQAIRQKNGLYKGLVTITNGHPQWTGKVALCEDKLDEPLHWKAPRRIFVDSMSDLFYEEIPDSFIDRVFAVMALCPHHTFQILTKRAARMLDYCAGGPWVRVVDQASAILRNQPHGLRYPLANVHLGVSVENQQTADERIPLLLATPAAVRFISYEPALGPIDLNKVGGPGSRNHIANLFDGNALHVGDIGGVDFAWSPRNMLHWVICGGESGPGARPMHPEWAQSIRDQCQAAGVPFLFKQWGAWSPSEELWRAADCNGRFYKFPDGQRLVRVGKKAAGRLLDGREWNEFPNTAKAASL